MQKMILIPADQYDRMLESYDRAMEELHKVRKLVQTISVHDDDVSRQLKLYDLIDKYECDIYTAKLLLEDQEADESI